MHGGERARENFGRAGVGEPAAPARAVAPQGRARGFGIAHAVNVQRQPGRRRRLEQELLDLGAALVVAPIADPHQALARPLGLRRAEMADVRGFVPDEGARAPAGAGVNVRQRRAERQHAVIAGKIQRADRIGIADGAMMGVVEQQGEASAMGPQASQRRDQFGRAPFVDEYEIGAVHSRPRLIQIRPARRLQAGISCGKGTQARFAMVREQVGEAPRRGRLHRAHIVAGERQFAQQAAQKMRVAMVPARQQRMGEIDDLHATAPVERRASAER